MDRSKMNAEVSVIIPAWHEEGTIARTLDSLRQLSYPLKDCELIVNASADDSTYFIAKGKSMPEFGRYLVLRQNPGGKNSALQQGIREARGESLVLLDADTCVDKNWLSEMISPLRTGHCCANGNWFPLKKSWINNYSIIEKVWARELLRQQSTNGRGGIAFKRELIDSIGLKILFDDKIHVGVDHNFGDHLVKRGYKVYFAEKARTMTPLNLTLRGFIHRESRWLRGYVKIIDRTRLIKIIVFNSAILLSFLLPLFSYALFIPISIYLVFLMVQCAYCSAKCSDFSYLAYFPIHLFLNIIGRSITLFSASSELLGLNEGPPVHFKGER